MVAPRAPWTISTRYRAAVEPKIGVQHPRGCSGGIDRDNPRLRPTEVEGRQSEHPVMRTYVEHYHFRRAGAYESIQLDPIVLLESDRFEGGDGGRVTADHPVLPDLKPVVRADHVSHLLPDPPQGGSRASKQIPQRTWDQPARETRDQG